MYTVSSEIYDHVAALLVDAIADKGFFSGSIATCRDEVYMRLTATVVVYRNTGVGESRGAIADIVPVWWEFHTLCGSEEIINDFSFATLREHLA